MCEKEGTMITIMFIKGNQHVMPVSDVHHKLLQKLTGITDSIVWKFDCSIHKSHSRGILLVDAIEGSFEWDIVDLCCNNFRKEIIGGMPPPWNHAPGFTRVIQTG